MFKKLISSSLVIIMLLSVCALSASAATTPANKSYSTVVSRLNTLVEKLDGKYFTTNQSSCSSSKSDACYNKYVIKASWLKNTMGLVPSSSELMPIHYVNGSGGYITSNAWSCAGFANYCLWYIYAAKSTDDVFPKLVYSGKFTKSDLDKSGIWPGDVIRVGNSHSMIYISHNSTGIKVIDSNFNYNNKVQVHTIKFGNWKSGQVMAITRGKNYTSSSKPSSSSGNSNSVTSFSTNFKFKSGAYTNAYSNYKCTSYTGRVYPNDVVTIKRVYSNGVAQLSCPWGSSGYKTVYCKISQLKFKATKYINAYSNVNGSYCGRVYKNDLVTISAIYSSGWMKVSCPWTGGVNKTVYIKCSAIY